MDQESGLLLLYRLFMVPGGGHVTGGPGPNSFDALSAVRSWVERGTAPERWLPPNTRRTVLRTRSR
ncbi:tannase/feruloyl esterase family alpha/beta hydrolase [Streptomyces kunmingensis]